MHRFWRCWLAIALMAVLASCAATPYTSKRGSVRATIEAFLDEFNRCDVDGLVARFTEDATLISSGAAQVIRGREGIRRYYERICVPQPLLRADMIESEEDRYGNSAVVSGRYTVTPLRDAQPQSVVLLFSASLVRVGDAWQVAALHASAASR